MAQMFLQEILDNTRSVVERAKIQTPLAELKSRINSAPQPRSFKKALREGGFGLIAELKRRSPSVGEMAQKSLGPAVKAYDEHAVVKAVSILTDSKYFGMSIRDLDTYRNSISKPILRKDFIIDEYQIYEARAFGADAVLLMSQCLTKKEMKGFYDLTEELGMEALVECRTKEQILEKAPENAEIIGVNSRTFESAGKLYRASQKLNNTLFNKIISRTRDLTVEIDKFSELSNVIADNKIKVAESGISSSKASMVRALGYSAALVGTALLNDSSGVQKALTRFEKGLSNPGPSNSPSNYQPHMTGMIKP